MTYGTDGAAPKISSHQLLITRGSNLLIYRTLNFTNIEPGAGFIPLALIVFVGLAGVAAWLGQVGTSMDQPPSIGCAS